MGNKLFLVFLLCFQQSFAEHDGLEQKCSYCNPLLGSFGVSEKKNVSFISNILLTLTLIVSLIQQKCEEHHVLFKVWHIPFTYLSSII